MPHYVSRGLGLFQRPTSPPAKASLSPPATFSHSATKTSLCSFTERVSSCHRCLSDLLKSASSWRIFCTFHQAAGVWEKYLPAERGGTVLSRRLPAAPKVRMLSPPPHVGPLSVPPPARAACTAGWAGGCTVQVFGSSHPLPSLWLSVFKSVFSKGVRSFGLVVNPTLCSEPQNVRNRMLCLTHQQRQPAATTRVQPSSEGSVGHAGRGRSLTSSWRKEK